MVVRFLKEACKNIVPLVWSITFFQFEGGLSLNEFSSFFAEINLRSNGSNKQLVQLQFRNDRTSMLWRSAHISFFDEFFIFIILMDHIFTCLLYVWGIIYASEQYPLLTHLTKGSFTGSHLFLNSHCFRFLIFKLVFFLNFQELCFCLYLTLLAIKNSYLLKIFISNYKGILFYLHLISPRVCRPVPLQLQWSFLLSLSG